MSRPLGDASWIWIKTTQRQTPLSADEAKAVIDNYIRSSNNPNIRVGKMKDTEAAFEFEIVTKENSLVDKVLVDKNTSWFRSVYT